FASSPRFSCPPRTASEPRVPRRESANRCDPEARVCVSRDPPRRRSRGSRGDGDSKSSSEPRIAAPSSRLCKPACPSTPRPARKWPSMWIRRISCESRQSTVHSSQAELPAFLLSTVDCRQWTRSNGQRQYNEPVNEDANFEEPLVKVRRRIEEL